MRYKVGAENIEHLFLILTELGYNVIGPKVADGVINLDALKGIDELPIGFSDQQAPGSYQLQDTDEPTYFGFQVGPQHWRRYLQPSQQLLWRAKRTDNSFEIIATDRPTSKPLAFFGVRSCDLHAIAELDKVFLKGDQVDPNYKLFRESLLIVAVNCSEAGDACFCHSTNTGPHVERGYDLVLDELYSDEGLHFLIGSGSPLGEKVINALKSRCELDEVAGGDTAAVEAGKTRAIKKMEASSRQLFKSAVDPQALKKVLYQQLEHPYWDTVAERCLSCGNCTMACPTCFCSDVVDETNINDDEVSRVRYWDGCFNANHSHLADGPVRNSTKSRYRQWIVHKFAAWQDQFGKMGCVGCGRCTTWCPVGIDVVQTINELQEPTPPSIVEEVSGER